MEPPLRQLNLERLLANEALKRDDARLVFRDQVGSDVIVVEVAELVLLDAVADQVSADVELLAQSQERLAAETGIDDHALQGRRCTCGAVLS